VRCTDKKCDYEHWNHTPESTVRGLQINPSSRIDCALASLALNLTDIPSCPRCQSFKLRPGVCWFGEELPLDELNRVERWFQDARKVDLVLVIGTERTPFVREAQSKGAEVAWLNLFEDDLVDTGGDWYVSGNASETLPALVDRALQ
jgi:NAD-dependent SIR2 family protein deacetylase